MARDVQRPRDRRPRDRRPHDRQPRDDGREAPRRARVARIGALVLVAASALAAAVMSGAAAIGVSRASSGAESTDDAWIDGRVHVVSARVRGTAIAVDVRENQAVAVGMPLVRMTADPAAVAAVAQSRADLASAEAARSAARAELAASTTTRAGTTAVPRRDPRDLAARRARVTAADAQVAWAAAALSRDEQNTQQTTLLAPVDGIVSRSAVRIGQIVEPGQPLVTILPRRALWVTAQYEETRIAHIRPGQRALIVLSGSSRRTITGRVQSIAPTTAGRFHLFPPRNATRSLFKAAQRVPVRILLDIEPDDASASIVTAGAAIGTLQPKMIAGIPVTLRQGMSVRSIIYTR